MGFEDREGLSRHRKSFWIAVATLLIGLPVMARTSAARSGHEDYDAYCAECHGADGKGNGPGTRVLSMDPPPPDLTKIARNNGGKFPFDEVVAIIDGRKDVPSHERIQMPFLGVTLQQPGKEYTPESDVEVKRRIEAMARYVESLQQK